MGRLNYFGGGGYDREANPIEAGLRSATMTNNLFAQGMAINEERQRQQEEAAIKAQMGSIDMNNPDYAKIFSLAPEFGMKFMNGMAQLNQQQRLTALNQFQIGQDIIQRAIPLYAMNPTPQARTGIASALKAAKYDDNYINAILPDPAQYPDQKSFQTAMLASMNVNEYMKGLNEQIKQGMITNRTQQQIAGRQKQIETQVAGNLAVADKHQASALLTSTGKPQDYYDETSGQYHTMRMTSNGQVMDVTHPKGFVPANVRLQQLRPAPGAGKGKAGPITMDDLEKWAAGEDGQVGTRPQSATDDEWNLYNDAKQEVRNNPAKLKQLKDAAIKKWGVAP